MTGESLVRSGWAHGLLVGLLLASPVHAAAPVADATVRVVAGSVVSLEYTLTLDDHTVLESNVGKDPMTYVQGAHEIVPGLETALDGMALGERKQIVVDPINGYGLSDPQAIHEVRKALIPLAAQTVGAQLQGQSTDGLTMFPIVQDVKADTVVLNFNHPLAGKTLYFDVTVVAVQPGPPPPQP